MGVYALGASFQIALSSTVTENEAELFVLINLLSVLLICFSFDLNKVSV